ncbi:MAG: helix-turn-helix domain-containing protein [Candidatus Thiothrix putei]|uniref:Helix-turn-helix domain-containing protein n=1 Tax=Candidatus Thiothrix putei TaxID=3080811 RepID=A0AA95HFI5_9GAMM|nr:MAG: helix-turn-helix domain-containing protein [Candidatus Thiothrix putei]
MQTLALLLIGFSVFSAVLLAFTHFRCHRYTGQATAQIMGMILLVTLAGLQLAHFVWLQDDTDVIHSPYYQVLLFTVAPAFYLFSKPLLQAQTDTLPRELLHLLPILIAPLLPFAWALPLAFALGAGYLAWLARSLYALREQRSRFSLEFGILSVVFATALVVLVFGIALPLLSEKYFFMAYASAIGLAFLLVNVALSIAPQLPTEVAEVARETYAVSTLTNIDTETMLAEVEGLMQEHELFRQPDLDLPTLAERVGLSSHQLSELINTRLGKSFSRYVREFRVEAAEDMLLEEPSASVLSVGMSVGFTSQSNFYEAFREITGMTPGQYRKIQNAVPE